MPKRLTLREPSAIQIFSFTAQYPCDTHAGTGGARPRKECGGSGRCSGENWRSKALAACAWAFDSTFALGSMFLSRACQTVDFLSRLGNPHVPFLTFLDDKPLPTSWEATVAMEKTKTEKVEAGVHLVFVVYTVSFNRNPNLMPRFAACYLPLAFCAGKAPGTRPSVLRHLACLPQPQTRVCSVRRGSFSEARAELQCMKCKLFPTVGEMWIKWRGREAAFF